jgi:hypothetical protein
MEEDQEHFTQGPGWFRDPWRVEPYRWWNGESWTGATWPPDSTTGPAPNIPTGIGQESGPSSRALWSVVLPIIGWILNPVALVLSNHFGNVSTIAGLNDRNNAGVIAFLVAAAIDELLGVSGILLAVGTKRTTRSSVSGQTGTGMATVGLILSTILIVVGVVMLLIGVFLNSLRSITF